MHIVSSFGQASHYESPSFSMDDFEGISILLVNVDLSARLDS